MEQDPFLQARPVENITPVKWMLYLLLTSIPLIGTVMLFVWAFSNDGRPVRQSWAKGMLLYYLVALIVTVIFFVIFGAAILAAAASNGVN